MNVDAKVLIELLEAALAADYTKVRRLGGELARLATESGETETASRMRSLTRKKGVALQTSGYTEPLPVDAGSRLPLIEEQDWPGTPVFLNEEASGVVSHFIEDAMNIELLTNKGLSPRLRLMLSGEPGTGKSLLAG
ncbi:MAG: ATPase, partial [Mesorhizobium sp.]